MTFDTSQLVVSAPLWIVIASGVLLLLLEAFSTERSRTFLMPVTLAALGLALFAEVLGWPGADETHRYAFGETLDFDKLSAASDVLFLSAAALAALLAPAYMREHGCEYGEFYALLLFATAGMMTLTASSDFATLFLGVETMSVAVYVLTGGWRRNARSSEGAMKYFLSGAFASAVLLYGIALVYGAVGSTSFQQVAREAVRVSGQPLFLLGVAFLVAGFAFKVAAVPFHMWAPDAYEGAPTPVTGFMAAGVKAAAFVTMLRLFGSTLDRTEIAFGGGWAQVLVLLAVATMVVGNLAALKQDNVKRMLAYSSIAHAGYLLVGIVAVPFCGVDTVRAPLLFYLCSYTFTTLGAFGVVAWVGNRKDEGLSVDDWAGLGQRHPTAALAMTLFLLSLAGVPPTAGFFGKFYLFRAALEKTTPAMTTLIIVAVLNSVVSFGYYLRLVTAMYFREPGRERQPTRSAATSVALLVAAAAVLGLGLLPDWLLTRLG
jgi:NADH-quinone oxidoreductase subunit N